MEKDMDRMICIRKTVSINLCNMKIRINSSHKNAPPLKLLQCMEPYTVLAISSMFLQSNFGKWQRAFFVKSYFDTTQFFTIRNVSKWQISFYHIFIIGVNTGKMEIKTKQITKLISLNENFHLCLISEIRHESTHPHSHPNIPPISSMNSTDMDESKPYIKFWIWIIK